jgi:cell division septal protein FtsQ
LPAPAAIRRIARFLPSRRSLVAGGAVIAIAAVGYVIARETSIFAIDRVEVTGGSPAVDAQVSRALSGYVGSSLVGLDGSGVLQTTQSLPTVVSATYDRSFPSTLHVMIVPEQPVAVLRASLGAWVISARGRVMHPISKDGAKDLPRIWAAQKNVHVGETLEPALGGSLARIVASAGSLGRKISTAAVTDGVDVLHLSSGLEIVLGGPGDIALKAAVAERVMRVLPADTRVIDVSVPSRPVTSSG